jgi:hypothetical protein
LRGLRLQSGSAFFRQIEPEALTIFGTSGHSADAQFMRKPEIYGLFAGCAEKSGTGTPPA